MQNWNNKLLQYRLCKKKQLDDFAKMLATEMVQDLCTGKDISTCLEEEKTGIYQVLDEVIILVLGGVDSAYKLKNAIHILIFGKPIKQLSVFEKTFDYRAETCLNQLDTAYCYVLSDICNTPHPTAEQRLSWVLFFAAANGGLCFVEGQQALTDLLISDEKPISKIRSFYCVSLIYQRTTHHTNMNVDGERKSHRLWFPDPISLAAIDGFLKNRHELSEPSYSAWDCLQRIFNKCPNAKQLKKFKQNKIYLALALWFVQQPGKEKPAFIRAFASGNLPSASTSTNCLAALATQHCKPADLKQIEIGIYPAKRKVGKKKHRVTAHGIPLLKALRKACAIFDDDGHKRTGNDARRALKLVLTQFDELTSAEEILIEWVLAEFQQGGAWNSPAAGLRNLSTVGAAWLTICGETDLHSVDCHVLNQIYDAVIDLKKEDESKIYSTLNRLFFFANDNFSIELPDMLIGVTAASPHVRCALISEAHFQQLLTDIQILFNNENEEVREALLLMLIFARRLGLRPIEFTKLKLIELTPQGNAFLVIRPNEFGNNKSYCAYRIFELMPLMLEHERVAFWAYFKRRLDRVGSNLERLLFSIEAFHDVPFHTRTLSGPVGQLFAQYLGEPAPLYQLRHSAITIWQVIQFGSDETITTLTPYTLGQAKEIRKLLSRGEIQDRFFQISALAGHLSPDTSITTYCHNTDIILYESAKGIDRKYSGELWQKLCGIRPSTLNRWLVEQPWYRNGMKEYLPNKLEPFVKISLCNGVEHIAGSKQFAYQSARISNTRTEMTLATCEQILCSYDPKIPITEVADMCNLEVRQVDFIVRAANEIKAQYLTSKQQSPLYPPHYRGIDLPKLNFKSESQDMRTLCNSLSKLSESNQKKLEKVIHYVLSNISRGHSEIIFGCPSELKQFFRIAKLFTTENRWELEVSLLDDKKTAPAQWQKACGNVNLIISNKTTKDKKKYPLGQGRLYYLQSSDNKYCKNVQERHGYMRYSSNVFKRVIHLQAILFRAKSYAIEYAEGSQLINAQENIILPRVQNGQFELNFD